MPMLAPVTPVKHLVVSTARPFIARAAQRPCLFVLHSDFRQCSTAPSMDPCPLLQRGGKQAREQKAATVASGRPDVKHFKDVERALVVKPHARLAPPASSPEWSMPHTIWSKDSLSSVAVTHEKPEGVVDRAAYLAVQSMRTAFDLFSGYSWGRRFGTLDESAWLRRIIFLETVAGVPGIVGGMVRHLHSLRLMRKDQGWIHTLLSEAENERMHLMIALTLRKPGPLFRAAVVVAQGVFTPTFGLIYLMSPRFCHRFVGYLEEEAVKTYTGLLEEIDGGNLPMFATLSAPEVARTYYRLPKDASLRDVFACIRADESHHREVNHSFAGLQTTDANPFPPGY